MQHGGPGASLKSEQPLLDRRRLAAAGRNDQGQRQPRDAAGEVVDKAQRRRVRPVNVVHQQRHRPAIGQVRHQPVQTVQRGKTGGILHRPRFGLGMLEQDAAKARRAGERCRALHVAEFDQRPLQQLAHHPKGKARLELRRPRREHPQPALLGEPPGRLEQPRLPHPGLAQHHRHRPLALRRGQHRTPQRVQLGMAFQQASHRALLERLAVAPRDPREGSLLRRLVRPRRVEESEDLPPAGPHGVEEAGGRAAEGQLARAQDGGPDAWRP
jgi:hypothetical protein